LFDYLLLTDNRFAEFREDARSGALQLLESLGVRIDNWDGRGLLGHG
jgi:hypothetical protein